MYVLYIRPHGAWAELVLFLSPSYYFCRTLWGLGTAQMPTCWCTPGTVQWGTSYWMWRLKTFPRHSWQDWQRKSKKQYSLCLMMQIVMLSLALVSIPIDKWSCYVARNGTKLTCSCLWRCTLKMTSSPTKALTCWSLMMWRKSKYLCLAKKLWVIAKNVRSFKVLKTQPLAVFRKQLAEHMVWFGFITMLCWFYFHPDRGFLKVTWDSGPLRREVTTHADLASLIRIWHNQ